MILHGGKEETNHKIITKWLSCLIRLNYFDNQMDRCSFKSHSSFLLNEIASCLIDHVLKNGKQERVLGEETSLTG